MSGRKKPQKRRVEFRKNRSKDPQRLDLTREVQRQGLDHAADLPTDQRISGKGSISRFRTIISEDDQQIVRSINEGNCIAGRVLASAGQTCQVRTVDDRLLECTVRQVLRRVSRDERTAVVAGDLVFVLPVSETEGVIERIEPRRGTLSRQNQRREHILVANVDQALIVVSADDPPFKPALIDRYLISSFLGGLIPLICINKADLVGPSTLQPWIGMYSALGYQILATSTHTGYGIENLRGKLQQKSTVVSGQSGVGKSSLLNAIQPGLELRTGDITKETRKGRHTTTLAQLHELDCGGWVVDTPGIRQMELWQVNSRQLPGFFIEFRPLLHLCQFPGCTHSHEKGCAVKFGVARQLIHTPRYESYLKLLSDLQQSESGTGYTRR